jgi:hypothetical protein
MHLVPHFYVTAFKVGNYQQQIDTSLCSRLLVYCVLYRAAVAHWDRTMKLEATTGQLVPKVAALHALHGTVMQVGAGRCLTYALAAAPLCIVCATTSSRLA